MRGPVGEAGPIKNSILLKRAEEIGTILKEDTYKAFSIANTPKYTAGTNCSSSQMIVDPIIEKVHNFLYVGSQYIPPEGVIQSWGLLPAVNHFKGSDALKRVLLYKLNMWKLQFPGSVYLDFMTVRAHSSHFPFLSNNNSSNIQTILG